MSEETHKFHCVVPRDGAFFYELAAPEIVLRLVVAQAGKDWDLNVHLMRYTKERMIRLLVDSLGHMELKKNRLKTVSGDRTKAIAFFDEHFKRLSGTIESDDPAQHKAFFDAHPALKIDAIFKGFGENLRIMPQEMSDEQKEQQLFMLTLAADLQPVSTVFEMVDAEGAAREIKLTHHFRALTAQNLTEYEQATGAERSRRADMIQMTQDYETIDSLYNRLIDHVDGYLLQGEPCVFDKKKIWRGLIPFFHKSTVVDELFTAVRAKNA